MGLCLNLIWTQAPESLAEADWIRWLFRDLEVAEYVAPRLDMFKNNAIYILSSNEHPLTRLPKQFLAGVERTRGKGLLHLSDESFSGGYEIYSNFDFVLKNHYSTLFDNPAIKVLPLGPTNNTINRSGTRSVGERKLLWSFAGARTAARMEMINHFKAIEPHECLLFDSRKQQTPLLDRAAFLALLSNTVFSPCPMGNVMLETFRLYESLEMGCIPIVERRRWMPYYDRLMPGHPLPTFSSWREARRFVEALSRDESALAECQRTVADWWQSYKVKLRNEVALFVSLGLHESFCSFLKHWNCRTGVKHQAWRMVELLKHASRASLQERIGITARRIISLQVTGSVYP
jgi:hypothetical protein